MNPFILLVTLFLSKCWLNVCGYFCTCTIFRCRLSKLVHCKRLIKYKPKAHSMICLMLSVLGHTIKRRSHSHHKSKEMIIACKFSHHNGRSFGILHTTLQESRTSVIFLRLLIGWWAWPYSPSCWTAGQCGSRLS